VERGYVVVEEPATVLASILVTEQAFARLGIHCVEWHATAPRNIRASGEYSFKLNRLTERKPESLDVGATWHVRDDIKSED